MPARVLIGGRWRRVSDAEAKYRRAKGQRVVDEGGNVVTASEPPAADIVVPDPQRNDAQGDPAIGHPTPTETLPADPPVVEGNGGMQGVDCDLCEENVEHAHAEAALATAPGTIRELTDAELERLTAPEPTPAFDPAPEPTRTGRRGRRSQRED